MLKIVIFLILPVLCCGFFFTQPDWNGLKVTWGVNPFTSFNNLPRILIDARSNGWVPMATNSGCSSDGNFKGERYVKDNDMGVVLIYDPAGYIAGIQIGFPENYSPNPNNYPPQSLINSPFVLDNGHYFLTAYFVNPENICASRTHEQFDQDGTGEGLWIQNGSNPITDSIRIPSQQSDIDNTRWTQGECFYTMGVHYWYNIRRDMSCDEFFPVFLMYNDGVLNSFGWALGLNIVSSAHLEHPIPSTYNNFLRPVPRCLMDKGTMTTLHIYMTDSPRLNWC